MVAFREDHDPAEPDLPQALIDGLKALYGSPAPVPPAVDRAILKAARNARRPRPRWSSPGAWVSAAGAIAACLAIGVWWEYSTSRVGESAPVARKPAIREDINGDGQVNVLDAFLLAKRVDRHEPLDSSWDINGDGRVDRQDADRIAAAAVRIDRGPAS